MNKQSRIFGLTLILNNYFFIGAFSLVFQTILMREFFVVAAGNEISLAITLSGWLLGILSGSLLAGYLSGRLSNSGTLFSMAILALCLIAPLLLTAIRLLHGFSAVSWGMLMPLDQTLLYAVLFTMPGSFFVGLTLPLAAKLKPLSAGNQIKEISRVYIVEALGSLLGGLVYTFYLVETCNPFFIIALFSLPLLLGSAALLWQERRVVFFIIHVLVLGLNGYAFMPAGAARFNSWLTRQRWQELSNLPLLAARDSRYQNLQLGAAQGQYSLFANGQLAAVFPDEDLQLIQAARIITQHPAPKRILIIGEGASGLLQQLLKYNLEKICAVEIDALYLEMITSHLPTAEREVLRDPRVTMLVMDGRKFVRAISRKRNGSEKPFDLVFLHLGEASTAQLNRFYTREFFQDLKKIIAADGVVALRIVSAENYAAGVVSRYTATVFHTLKSVFPCLAVSPGPNNYFFASAAPQSVSTSPAVLAKRYARLVESPVLSARLFTSIYPEEKTAFITQALADYPHPVQNSDDRPIAYFLYQRLLGFTSGSPLTGLFDFFEKIKLTNLLMILAVILLLGLAFSRRQLAKKPARLAVLLAAASAGFAGLSFEILAIFVFQNICGYVYGEIGLLVALFMLGLSGGAFLAQRLSARQRLPLKKLLLVLASDQMLIAFLALIFLPLLRWFARCNWSAQPLLFGMLTIMGALVGGVLPLALHVYGNLEAGRAAGMLNASDYLGGAIGAAATASFFLPFWGLLLNMMLIAALAAVAGLLLLVNFFWLKFRGNVF